MTSDETIHKVADVIAGKTTELGSSTMRGLDRAVLAARALAESGLLAPDMREEWGTRFENGHLIPGKGRDYNLWFKGDPPKGVNVRRYVTDWEEQ